MAVWSIIDYQKASTESRIDAEYFKPEYLELDSLLSKANVDLWGNLDGDFITGPFGSAFTVDKYVEKSPYRYIRGKDVKPFFLLENDNVYMAENEFENLTKYRLEEEDLLISVVGTLGNIAIVDENIGEAVFSCKSTAYRSKSINPYYLCAYLNSNIGQSYFQRKPRGTIQTGLNIDDLRTIPLYIPNHKIQQDIGNLVKKSRSKLKQSEALYAQAEQLLLQELGLENLDLSPQTSYVANFDETVEAKRIDAEYFQPKYRLIVNHLLSNYETKSLEELGKVDKGKSTKYSEIGIPVIRSGDLTDLDDLNNLKYADSSQSLFYLKKGDICISSIGFGSIGKVQLFDKESKFATVSEVTVIRQNEINPYYLQIFLQSLAGQLQIEQYITGATGQLHIYPRDIAKIFVPIIAQDKQEEFESIILRSRQVKQEAKDLLEDAKNKVEQMILQND